MEFSRWKLCCILLGRINDDPTILPGIRLGALAFDTCDNPSYALEQAFYFVKGNGLEFPGFPLSLPASYPFPPFRPVGFIGRGSQLAGGGYRCEDRTSPKFLDGGFWRRGGGSRRPVQLGYHSGEISARFVESTTILRQGQCRFIQKSNWCAAPQSFLYSIPSEEPREGRNAT